MIDKDALRKTKGSIIFDLRGKPAECMVLIDPRPGDRWRVTIFDDDRLTEHVCHVEDIMSETTSELELLKVALDAYFEYRGRSD